MQANIVYLTAGRTHNRGIYEKLNNLFYMNQSDPPNKTIVKTEQREFIMTLPQCTKVTTPYIVNFLLDRLVHYA